jgi:hypothetical protein
MDGMDAKEREERGKPTLHCCQGVENDSGMALLEALDFIGAYSHPFAVEKNCAWLNDAPWRVWRGASRLRALRVARLQLTMPGHMLQCNVLL